MQNDHTYDPHGRKRAPAPEPTPAAASKTFGAVIAWVLIGLVGVLIASGLLALIVTLWRVIL